MRFPQRQFAIACLTAVVAACGTSTPPPSTTPGEKITGAERIGWDQQATNATELASFRYAIYVDNARSELADVSCSSTATAAGFACSARLPAMSAGTHSLQIAAFIVAGDVLESSRSAPLTVTVGTAVTSSSAPWQPTTIITRQGTALRAELFRDGFTTVTDLAAAPDGRLFVAERNGHIVAVDTVQRDRAASGGLALQDGNVVEIARSMGVPSTENRSAPLDDLAITGSAGGLLAIAVDPQFARTHFVYALYTAGSRNGGVMFRVSRIRESNGTFAEAIVLLDGVNASSDPVAALRFGADGKLYAAFDDGGNAAARDDFGDWNGKVLRLNIDGTTPADQASGSPLFSAGYQAPRALAWTSSGAIWIADALRASTMLNGVVAENAREVRATTRVRVSVPQVDLSGLTVYRADLIRDYRNDVFVAAGNERCLVRLTPDAADPLRFVSTERLLQDVAGPIRAVTVGMDGAIYFATDTTIGKLAPANK